VDILYALLEGLLAQLPSRKILVSRTYLSRVVYTEAAMSFLATETGNRAARFGPDADVAAAHGVGPWSQSSSSVAAVVEWRNGDVRNVEIVDYH
jgi:hypothetical protein